ncbi:hypothetical protein AURDEDRAFT_183240 [Auricularia subglabra TFB-10046 SS5]|nr:hypothetical protein AURDEDRAFT_183240 [Auricularia subglabra TFB-10046 SS5]
MSTAEQMRQRLWDELRELDSLANEVAAVRAQEALALAAAQAAKLRLSELQQRRAAVVKDTKSIMRMLNTVADFPFELLSLIFTYANTTCDFGAGDPEDFSPAMQIDVARCTLPLRLGLVCRRWRAALLSTPAVWGYVGISFDAAGKAGFGRAFYVEDLLAKSGSSPLDVVICYQLSPGSNSEEADRLVLNQEEHFRRIVCLLQMNMGRIRSLHVTARQRNVPLEVTLPEITRVRTKVLDLLRTPAPSLVDLRIQFPCAFRLDEEPAAGSIESYWHGAPDKTMPLFLPFSPKLRNMRLGHVPVVCRRPHPGLPSLERVSISQRPIYEAHVVDLLAASPNLQYLNIDVSEVLQSPQMPVVRTSMPRLSKVHFGDYPTFGLLANGAALLPSLSELHVGGGLGDISVSDNLARNLTRLHISWEDGLEEHVETLRRLSNIAHAEFWQGSMRDDLFFAPFFDAEAPMWPRLETLKLNAVVTDSAERDSLLRLIQARNCGTNPSVRPLKNVDYDNVPVPSWIDVQIRAILPEVCEDGDP